MAPWLQLFFLVGWPILFFIVLIAWIIDHVWLTPEESKIIKKATRKKRGLTLAGFDNRQAEFKMDKEVGEEGYRVMEDGWIGLDARPVAEGNPEPDKELDKANSLMRETLMLKHAKIPISIAYVGKAILTNPKALAVMQYAENTKQNVKLPFTIEGKKLIANVLWYVDSKLIKKAFPKSYNEAQIRAFGKRRELVGVKKGEKYYGREGLKYFVLPGMIIIAIIIGILAIMVLG
jgi:hypothetical protein